MKTFEKGRLSAFKEMRDWAEKAYVENEEELNLSEDTHVNYFRDEKGEIDGRNGRRSITENPFWN